MAIYGRALAKNSDKAWCFTDTEGQLQGPFYRHDLQKELSGKGLNDQTEISDLATGERKPLSQWEELKSVVTLAATTGTETNSKEPIPKMTECPKCSRSVSLRATE